MARSGTSCPPRQSCSGNAARGEVLTAADGPSRVRIPPCPIILANLFAAKTALVTGAAQRLGRASALALAQAGADVAITFRNSAREARETVVDLSRFGVRAFALRCDVTDEASVRSHDERRRTRIGPHRHSGQQRGELRDRGVRKADGAAMGCDFRLQHARSVSGVARSSEVDAAEARQEQRADSAKIEATKSSTWDRSAACGRGRRTRTIARRRPRCTC